MADLTPLVNVMSALRDPDKGCPWDIKQTPASITKYTLEETYELLDAIESGDLDNQKEELGDLLFHIVFYSQMANEQQQFDINDVISTIVNKMIHRHPHVFDPDLDNKLSDEELYAQWKEKKLQEKKGNERVLDPVSPKQPAMMRCQQLQDKAAEYHFDWPEALPVLDKIEEEIGELREALENDDQQHIQDEMGDLLFACVNLARHIDIDAESALRQSNEKFIRRFDYVVQQMQASGIEFSPEQLDQMETFWQQAKKVTG
jgi:ATP diphosphatase